MGELLADRYYAYSDEDAWDLATGKSVPRASIAAGAASRTQAYSCRASSCRAAAKRGRRGDRELHDALIELLDHGREGHPRWVAIDAALRRRAPDVLGVVAREAAARGFVPIAADVYLHLRAMLAEDLDGRALLILARPGLADDVSRDAFVRACAAASRPHVLLTFRPPADPPTAAPVHPPGRRRAGPRDPPHPFRPRPAFAGAAAPLVREARAAYGAEPVEPRSARPLGPDVARHLARAQRAGEFMLVGRHAAAERLLRDVCGALVRREALVPACRTLVTLGRLLLERGRASAAAGVFRDAAGYGTAGGGEAAALSARLWQASAHADEGRLAAAESLVRAVLLAGPLSDAERARALATLARVLLWQRRIDEIDLDGCAPNAGEEHWAYVQAVAVRVALARGDLFAAGQRARSLLDGTTNGEPLQRLLGLTAYLRVIVAAGDLAAGEACLRDIALVARRAHMPLRLLRARLAWVDALRRAGRASDARRLLDQCGRCRPAASPLLRTAIDERIRGLAPAALAVAPVVAHPAIDVAAFIRSAQDEDADRDAVLRLLAAARDATQASRVDLWSAAAGPATVVVSAGTGIATHLGSRTLETGTIVGPEPLDAAHEMALPVRLGGRLLGAVAIRWPVDRLAPPHARELLDVIAAVAAPRVDLLLRRERQVAGAALAVPELVGGSSALQEVRAAITRAAGAPFALLVEGESGVGKELVARAVHQMGVRRERRFCDVNCAAMPDDLLESELFGHARGAFTGAVTDRPGLFEEADGGTIFLDEVADLSPRAQAKLLRVVQQQEVRRIGESFTRKIDVRIVSAANRDMRQEAAEGRFRQDLLYRLDVIRIRIPPLRDRPDDIAPLAEHFWHAAAARVGTSATLTHAVLSALARYHWPGNVRELQNVMSALAVEAPARGLVRPSLLPAAISGAAALSATRLADAREQFERRFLQVALARAGGSRSRAARELGISRQGLLKLIARLGIT